MEGMKPSGTLEKKQFNPRMYMSQVCSETERTLGNLRWTIKYPELEENVLYANQDDNINWHLLLQKMEGNIKVSIRAKDLVGEIICSVKSSAGDVIRHVKANRIDVGSYEVEFSCAFEGPTNLPLKDGCVILHFIFLEKPETIKKVCAYNKKRHQSDVLELVEDLSAAKVSEQPVCASDFIIENNGREHNVPKALLAARSDFFKDCDVDKNKITLSTDDETLYSMIRFLYTGKLSSLDTSNICKLLEVSEVLKIKSLHSKCVLLAKEFSNRSTALQCNWKAACCVTSALGKCRIA